MPRAFKLEPSEVNYRALDYGYGKFADPGEGFESFLIRMAVRGIDQEDLRLRCLDHVRRRHELSDLLALAEEETVDAIPAK